MTRLSFAYLTWPALTMLIAIALMPVLGVSPVMSSRSLSAFQFVVGAPFWLGCAAAPGYIYAWAGHYDAPRLQALPRSWVLASLGCAFAASVTGAAVSLPAVVPFPFAVVLSVYSFRLLLRFLRSRAAEHR